MQGRRIADNLTSWEAGKGPEPGDYWKTESGWMGRTPNGYYCNLSAHTVVEHADGTVTVTPSILVSVQGKELWHGFLTNNNWTDC